MALGFVLIILVLNIIFWIMIWLISKDDGAKQDMWLSGAMAAGNLLSIGLVLWT